MGAQLFRIWLVLVLPWVCTAAGARASVEPLQLFNREVAELRAVLGGLTPAERVARAQRRFAELSEVDLAQAPQLLPLDLPQQRGLTLTVAGKPLFTLLEADLDPEERLPLAAAAERALRAAQQAIDARRAQRDPRVWGQGALRSGLVLVLVALAWWAAAGLQRRLEGGPADAPDATGAAAYWRLFLRRLVAWAGWLAAAGFTVAALLVVLESFPWTEPWGDRLHHSVRQLGGWVVAGVLGALPGLLTVAVIAVVARALHEALAAFMQQVQNGRLRVPFLHADTAGATRRLLAVGVWGLALAVAYPFLPGSDSDAFRGLSVLLGLMVTLGSTGIVTQLMSGLVVVYSRSLKKGDYVAVDNLEGVVSEVGALAVKIKTMRNEEVTLPNAVVTGRPIRNFSKLADGQGTLVSTRITIGYDAPWRQVHALLEAAAHATPGVRPLPAPFVVQRALSDFFVEYELFAHVDRPLDRVAIISALHAAIQDQFNAHGVQIMSPHYYEQPPQAVVVPPSRWHMPPSRPPQDEAR